MLRPTRLQAVRRVGTNYCNYKNGNWPTRHHNQFSCYCSPTLKKEKPILAKIPSLKLPCIKQKRVTIMSVVDMLDIEWQHVCREQWGGGQQCKSVLFTRAENVTELSFNFSLVFCISTGGYHRKESNSGVSVLPEIFVTFLIYYELLVVPHTHFWTYSIPKWGNGV